MNTRLQIIYLYSLIYLFVYLFMRVNLMNTINTGCDYKHMKYQQI